jgi:Tol biopolymer transport system component
MRKTILSFVIAIFLFNTASFAQNVIEKSENKVKLFNAQQDFYKQEYVKSLNLYKEVLADKPNDPVLIFHIGECNYMMEDVDQARELFEKSISIDPKAAPEAHLYLGKIYLNKSKLDSAGKEFSTYKGLLAGSDSKIKESDIDLYINMVKTAKELTAKPIDVKVINLGENINSTYDDKRPSITADGKTMVFTSRRPAGKVAADVLGDNKPFDHIYMASWNDTSKSWNSAEFMNGTINGTGHSSCSSITQDGKQIFIYRNNDDDARGGEIFVSKVSTSGKWGPPKIMEKPINSSYFEDGAVLTADGNTLFFISERGQDVKAKAGQHGFGNGDIWMAKRKTKTEWDTPVNLGPEINTQYDEGGLYVTPDGKTLFFCSQGHNSMGGYDIFKTTLVNGKWTTPVNLGYPINSVNNETSFNISVDGMVAYISSNRPGGLGERDIYKVDLSKYDLLGGRSRVEDENATKLSILKGTVFTGESGSPVAADLYIYDEAGIEVGKTTASDDGNYFITLEGGKNYEVKINVKGRKPVDEKFKLEKGKRETFTLVKHYLLYKE